MYRGRPWRMSYDGGRIYTSDLVDGHSGPILSLDDPDIDISSIELGYVNTYGAGNRGDQPNRTAVYISRSPSKQWRQGIHSSNITIFSVNGTGMDWSRESLLFSKGFEEMCMDKFPALSAALNIRPSESVALSKDIALTRTDFEAIGVYYKCKPVGYFDKKGSKFTPSETLPAWFIDEVYKNAIDIGDR